MVPEEQRHEEYSDLLKLTDSQFQALVATSLSSGDDGGVAASGGNNRDAGRLRFTFGKSIPITLQESNGALRNIRGYPIDISQTGMALFVGMFVHLKTKVCATLTFNDGERLIVNGTCVNCRMVSGRAHRIGVQFVKAFDMTLLLSPDQTATLASPADESVGAKAPPAPPTRSDPIPISAATAHAQPPATQAQAPAPSPTTEPTQADKAGTAHPGISELEQAKQATAELLKYVTGFAERIQKL